MKLVYSYLATMNRITLLLALCIILYFIGMVIWHMLIKKKNGQMKLWRLSMVIPFIVCCIHFYFHYFKGNLSLSVSVFFPFYIGAFAMLIWQFFADTKVIHKISTVFVGIASVFGLVFGVFNMTVNYSMIRLGNYSKEGYVESFDSLVADMKEHYVQNEWKEIDYDRIVAVIRPKVEEAEKNNDPVAYYKALYEYVGMFHDGHMWVSPVNKEGAAICEQAEKELAGQDYGFSLYTIDTGETIAVMVEEGCEANRLGIKDGTVITRWNGRDITQAINETDCILGASKPVLENEVTVKPVYFAGMGDETLEISFLNEEEKEITITVSSIGSYDKRLNRALARLYHYRELDNETLLAMTEEERQAALDKLRVENENFRTKMLSDDCGYLAVTAEEYDTVDDVIAEVKGEYPKIKELVNHKLEELKAQGMKKLVLDLRNNGGGYPIITCEIASLFTKTEINMGSDAMMADGEYKTLVERCVRADGRWADIPVVVLTNCQCGSSGDGLVYALSKCPNVTIMGITCSDGIYQSIGGYSVMTNSDFFVGYPCFLALDENGDLMIDTKADRITRIPLDVKIPVTKEGALIIFGENNNRDYEAEFAIRYLAE